MFSKSMIKIKVKILIFDGPGAKRRVLGAEKLFVNIKIKISVALRN